MKWSSKAVNPEDLVEVKMIDLAHTVRCGNEPGQEIVDLDHGYIHGLRVLLNILQNIVSGGGAGRDNSYRRSATGQRHGQSF